MNELDLIYDILKKLDKKQDEQNEKLAEINETLAENTSQLAIHMKRCDLLEESIDTVKNDIRPSIKFINIIEGIGRIVFYFSLIVGVIGTIVKIFK